MAITIEKTLLNNQSILQNIALVEEIGEAAAEIISGGQSVNKQVYAFDNQDNKGEEPIVEPEQGNSQQAILGFGAQRRWN
ncbi:hypothetical protein [Nostoc sp.]|uniref:hypothetical protein n=1 Tax=Nostoc sp. TaxID=1180 RepID=UPI002FFC3BB7